MIPLLLVGAPLALFTVAGQSVIKDSKNEIKDINKETEELINGANELIEKTNSDVEKSYNKLIKKGDSIYKSTLKRATEITDKIRIKNKRSKTFKEIEDLKNTVSDTGRSIPNIKLNNPIKDGAISGITYAMGGLVFGTVIEGVMLEYKIEEAKNNKAKTRAACEKVKTQCNKTKKLSAVMKNSYKTISGLNEIAVQSEEYVETLFDEKGMDINKWEEEDIGALRSMFNIIKALANIISTPVLTEEGEISETYKKLIGESENLISK